jgi:hypothetical protein
MTHPLDTLLQEFTQQQERFQKVAQERLKEYFAEFWEKNPAIKAIHWSQYAPYFNDGDPCTFSVHDPYFTNAEGDDLDDLSRWGEYDGEKEGVWSDQYPEFDGVNVESTDSLAKLLTSGVMEPIMKIMFGSDNVIVATREGFSVDYAEHD